MSTTRTPRSVFAGVRVAGPPGRGWRGKLATGAFQAACQEDNRTMHPVQLVSLVRHHSHELTEAGPWDSSTMGSL